MPGETILIVEDNMIVAFSLQRTLTRLGYQVLEPVDSGEAAVAAAQEQRFDLVLMDIGLSGTMDGITAAEQIQAMTPVPVIYLTGNHPDPRLKPLFCLSKPVMDEDLLALVAQVLRSRAG